MAEQQQPTMINTKGDGETPKRTPLLKLGRKKLGMNRTYNTLHEEPEESKGPANPMAAMATRDSAMECPFRECGRKFVSDPELKNHMTRRHKPAAPVNP